jgi:hypothetical protein
MTDNITDKEKVRLAKVYLGEIVNLKRRIELAERHISTNGHIPGNRLTERQLSNL